MKVVDLSQLVHASMPVYPGAEQPTFEQLARVVTDGFSVARVAMNYHVGTHVDAPAHMLKDGLTLDKFLADCFIGKAAIADFSDLNTALITQKDLQKYEQLIKDIDFLILKTAWSKHWGTETYYQQYPTLSVDAATWLTNFPLKGIGIDAISIDSIDTTEFPIHHVLLGKSILIIENLTNLNAVVDEYFDFCCMPVKIKDADGSPVRAVAIIKE